MHNVASRVFGYLSVCTLIPHLVQPLHAEEPYIEEVGVTAQKRAQALSDVPIAASAYTGATLENAGFNDAKTLILFTPGLAGAPKDSYADSISVRGISTNDFGIGGDPSIALFKNGVYAGRTGEVVTSFFDMERDTVSRVAPRAHHEP